ncbi:hypothetical protein BC831DRAFT_493790 [Entophlyctis helioformis]|nr:hypothetical protein BC831DRAFT_493790 [Entophlyctis helioformis]
MAGFIMGICGMPIIPGIMPMPMPICGIICICICGIIPMPIPICGIIGIPMPICGIIIPPAVMAMPGICGIIGICICMPKLLLLLVLPLPDLGSDGRGDEPVFIGATMPSRSCSLRKPLCHASDCCGTPSLGRSCWWAGSSDCKCDDDDSAAEMDCAVMSKGGKLLSVSASLMDDRLHPRSLAVEQSGTVSC